MEPLERVLAGLTADGTLQPEQASAVLAGVRAEQASRRGMTRGVEVLGYLGSALVLAAVLAILGQNWADLPTLARVLLLGLLSGAAVGIGVVVRDPASEVLERLVGLLWLLAVPFGGVAVGAAVAPTSWSPALVFTFGSVGAVVLAGVLYAARRAAAQQIGLFASITAVVGGVLGQAHAEVTAWSVTGIVVGLAWVAATRQPVLRPVEGGVVQGGLLLLVATQVLVINHRLAGLLVAFALVAASYWVAVRNADLVELTFGTVGAVLFLPQALDAMVGDALGGPVVVLLSGLVVLGAMAGHIRLVRRRARVGQEALT